MLCRGESTGPRSPGCTRLAALLSAITSSNDALAKCSGIVLLRRARSAGARLETETVRSRGAGLGYEGSEALERSGTCSLQLRLLDDLPTEVQLRHANRDDNNIEDLYRVAQRKVPEGMATNFWNSLVEDQDAEDYDPTDAKAITAVLALIRTSLRPSKSAAEQLVQEWLKTYQAVDAKLPGRKEGLAYEPVKRETRCPELTSCFVARMQVRRRLPRCDGQKHS